MMKQLFLLAATFVVANAILYGLDPGTNQPPCLQWTGGSFQWPCPSTKSLFKSSGKYITKNIIATRAQIYNDEVFVALPRYKSGIPVTLAKTSFKKGAFNPTFTPFPCWTIQEEGKCSNLQSVVDLVLDHNDVVWVLDTGVINTLEEPIRKCPPKIVAFSAKTGKLLKSLSLNGLFTPTSRLQYLVVDYAADGRCFVYVSDAAARAIIVYDVQAGKGFRVVLPQAICGSNKKDVLYLALVRKSCGTTVLYFTYLGSKQMYSIKTEFLRRGNAQGRITEVGLKPSKLVVIGTDNGSAIFFRYEGQSEVYRWDANTCFKPQNFRVVYKSGNCELATHAIADYKRGRMRVLESNFPDYLQNTVGCGAVQQLTIMQGCH